MSSSPAAGGPAPGRHERVAADEAGMRLDLAVAGWLDVSRTRAATLVATDRVRVNGKRERASYKVEPGDRLTADVPAPEGRDVAGEDIPLTIAYEDDEVIVVDKPAGMVVHPAPGHWSGTLVNALKGRGGALSPEGDPDRAGLVHRLDKDTSGLLLVARTERAHRVLSAALAARRVERKYAVACWGHLDDDRLTVDKPVGRDPRDRQKMAIVANGRTAKTDFRRLARFSSADLLQARLHTGRTHQIRIHLSSVGHPVLGDDTYGGGGGRRLAALPPRRHWLHAAWLRFPHPVTGKVVDVRSPLPADLTASLEALSEGGSSLAAPLTLEYFQFYHDAD
jgi:23S rRNA pseudouridine1911/1915/1917 synthase